MFSQEELDQLLAPSNQIHVGPLEDPDPISRNLATTGQLNPVYRRRLENEHGRYLSGFGETMTQPRPKELVAERAEHAEVYDLEDQDDVLGSGIFDPPRRPPTANANTGVLASRYSLPGYHAREIPFTVNSEITDITDDASVVGIPSGGMAYVEAHGTLQRVPALSPNPQPIHLQPAPPTTQYEPYVNLDETRSDEWGVDSILSRAEKGPQGKPVPPMAGLGEPAFKYPGYVQQLPYAHPPREPMWNVRQLPGRPGYAPMPYSPSQHRVPRTPTVTPSGASIALSGIDFSSATTWLLFLGAGVATGVALRLLFSKKKAA